MGRKKQRNSKLFIIPLILILALISTFIYLYILYNDLVFNNLNLEIKLNKNKKTISDYNQTISNLEKESELYKNIKENLENKKTEYLKNIRNLEESILKGSSNKKIAYITIDDGPYNKTDKFLEILDNYNATATFFVLLKPSKLETYKKIVASGHTLGNHTASHKLGKNGIYSSKENFINDIYTLENWLYENVGVKTTLFRFPGGSPTAGKLKLSIASELKEKGYSYVDWNVIVGDGSDLLLKQKRPYEWFKEQIKDKKIALILMHDYSEATLEDLPKILQYLKTNDYMILPLSNQSIMVN